MTLRFDKENTSFNDGFTLAEMLVVLMIVALMTTLSFPYLAGRNKSSVTDKLANDMVLLFKKSKQIALIQNEKIEIIFLLKPRGFNVARLNETVKIPPTVDVKIVSGQDETTPEKVRIVFYPDGSSSGGSVRIVGQKKTYVIDVDWLTSVIELKQEQTTR